MLGLYTEEMFGFQSLQLGFLFSGLSLMYVVTQLTMFPKFVASRGKRTWHLCGQ